MKERNKERTTINISPKTLKLLRKNLGYVLKDGKHYQETYEDLIKRLIEMDQKNKE